MAWILLWRAAASAAVEAPISVQGEATTLAAQGQGGVQGQTSSPWSGSAAAAGAYPFPCKGVEREDTDSRITGTAAPGAAAPSIAAAGTGADATCSHVPSPRLSQLRSSRELRLYDWMTQNVPRTAPEAFRLFFSRPAILTCAAVAGVALTLRLMLYPAASADIPVALAVALWWVLQEWLIHAKLLHSAYSWWGKDIHIAHHNMPYHHISIDGFKVVGPTMVLSFLVFRIIFQEDSLFLTALATYYLTGLTYEWTHFLVHTKVPMRSYAARIIKRAHVKHHLRDDHFWFSFTCPPLDNLMGTTPSPWVVG